MLIYSLQVDISPHPHSIGGKRIPAILKQNNEAFLFHEEHTQTTTVSTLSLPSTIKI